MSVAFTIEHSDIVVLPSIGVRQHRLFLTHRPNYGSLVRRPAPITPGVPVSDDRYDESTVAPTALSILFVLILCLTVLRAV